MSDKPRVYQGVRVRTTVKELLQRLRAREDNSRKAKTISQACSELQDLCASTFTGRFVAPPPVVPAADASSCAARTFQLDGSCNAQMLGSSFSHIQQQFGDMMLPGNGYAGNNNSSSNNNNNNTGSGYSACLPPPPAFPLPCCHGLSSDADFYGHGMAPCSSPEPLKLCNPTDHSSYSPQDSFSSSSSSSCYDSPTRMESGYRGLPSEHFHYQHCSLQDCLCSPRCWPVQQESFSAPEYAPYYPPTDYPYACPVEENYFRRDSQMSSEMCYNVL